jgi:serine O-acetyltransferase
VAYRFGRWSLNLPQPLRWMTSKIYGILKFVIKIINRIEIDRTTEIGADLHIIHTENISIHPEAVIGSRCSIMHGVTIGTNMFDGCPKIGNDVFIGCGASILGNIKIGSGARIAANSLVVTDVPPGAVAMGVPAKIYPQLSRLDKLKEIAKRRKRSRDDTEINSQ